MKKLAVLLPTYNASPYIKSSIDSLLDQTFSDFDIYIYDDCSTDDTSEIIDSYNHPRIFYRKNESNLGIAKTLNKGLDELLFHYEYIARMDADDWCFSERFEKQLEYLENNLDTVICGTQGYWLKDIELTPKKGWTYPTNFEYIKYYLLFAATFGHSSIILRTQKFIDFNLRYDETITTCEDWELWIRVSKIGKLSNLEDFLMKYRILENSNHRSPEKIKKHLKERSKIISDYWADFNVSLSPKQIFDFYYSEVSLSKQQFMRNAKILIQSFNIIYSKASQDLTIEECRGFRYMLARRILNYWKRAKLSRFDVVIWWRIVREVKFMNTLKLIKSIIR